MEESKWSHIPSDILGLIANRLNNHQSCTIISAPIIHNLRLRSVCKSWRSSVPLSPHPPTPVLVPFPLNPNHVTLSHSTFYLLQHQPSSSSSLSSSRYWLLRVENDTEKYNMFRPLLSLNPLSKTRSKNGLPEGFPKSINLLDFHVSRIHTSHALEFVDPISFQELRSLQPRKVAVSNSIIPVVIMAISGPKMWIHKIEDNKMTEIDGPGYVDVVFHKGKFYAVDDVGRLVSVDVTDLTVVEIVSITFSLGCIDNNLVVCNDELYLVHQYYAKVWYDEDGDDYYSMPDEDITLKIYRLKEEEREWERV